MRSIFRLMMIALLLTLPLGPAAQGQPAFDTLAEEESADTSNPDFSPAEWAAMQDYDPALDIDSHRDFDLERLTEANLSYLRYNQVRQKSSHNSYERQEALLDQMIYHRIRSLELDIHRGKGSRWPSRYGDWYVYHVDIPGLNSTTCHRLSDCLQELRAFHLAFPQHEVVTIFIDLKDDWGWGQYPSNLDSRIATHLPSNWVYTPSELQAACPGATTLQQSVTGACGWPSLSSLRGQFIFALTGGTSKLLGYAASNSTATSHTAFIAPEITGSGEIDDRSWVVFFNMDSSHSPLASSVDAAGFVGRAYGLNGSFWWNIAKTYRAHHLGTDKVNFHQDSWAVTHNSVGWPFGCFIYCNPGPEAGRILGVEVNSEDIWGSSDHFRFEYENTSTVGNLWTASVSTANSHMEDWSKGCLMARYSTAKNSPYFAVCRPGDDHKVRIQWRSSFGGGSSRTDGNIVPDDTIDEESISFLRLYVYSNNKCAAGYGSQDGGSWVFIGARCFSYTLGKQGIASSSHGNKTVKFLYGNVAKNGAPYYDTTFPFETSIGTVRSARSFDGVFP